jgi:ketol-acid reductoisomerase
LAKVYYDNDADLELLKGKRVCIVGYGSQGHAHAQNLRDSGVRVHVADLPESKGWKAAEHDGFEVMPTSEGARAADIVMILVNDEYPLQAGPAGDQHRRIHGGAQRAGASGA